MAKTYQLVSNLDEMNYAKGVDVICESVPGVCIQLLAIILNNGVAKNEDEAPVHLSSPV